jgi:branched-chain amino acid transport system ATP-binding protein
MSVILSTDSLTKDFGGLRAIDSVSLTVREGEAYAIIGPNGAGKSTLLNLLSGLLPASSGRMSLQGNDITGLTAHIIRARGLARTFQNGRLFERLTVLENVMVGANVDYPRAGNGALVSALTLRSRYRVEEENARAKAMAALELLGLGALAERPVSGLPYGTRRTIEIARALAAETVVLLLDEPAAGLNASETQDLRRVLQILKDRGVTVVLIEHDMHLIMRWADRIAVINFGAKIAEDTPAAVRRNKQVIEAYLGSGSVHADG